MLKKEEGKTQDIGLMRTWVPMENAKVALHWQCVSNWTTSQMLQNIFDWLCYSISMRSQMWCRYLCWDQVTDLLVQPSLHPVKTKMFDIWSIWVCIICWVSWTSRETKGNVTRMEMNFQPNHTFLPGWNGTSGPPVTSTATTPASWIAQIHILNNNLWNRVLGGEKGFLPNQTITSLYSTCCLGLLCLKMRAGVQVFIRLKNQINFHVLCCCCNKYPYRKEVTIW